MAGDVLNPLLGADHHARVKQAREDSYRATLRLLFKNALQDGRLPGTVALEPEEEHATLMAMLPQLLQAAQSAPDPVQQRQAIRGLQRLRELHQQHPEFMEQSYAQEQAPA